MMADKFIDRRKVNNKNTAINRQKWLDRLAPDIINRITDSFNRYNLSSNKIALKLKKEIAVVEPEFHYSLGDGLYYYMSYDNDKFRVGDIIDKPSENEDAANGGGSNDPNTDTIDVEFDAEELKEMLIGDIVLPNLTTKEKELIEITKHKGGYASGGAPSQLSVKKSFKEAIARRNAVRAVIENEMKEIETEMDTIERFPESFHEAEKKYAILENRLAELEEKLKHIPLIEKHDLKYRSFYTTEVRQTKAVLFLLMDVSSSMNGERKSLAKIGCYLFNYLLKKQYPNLEVVFIRHAEEAERCDERKFFYTDMGGGTVLSSATILAEKIIKEEYSPDVYNIYMIQISDGGNFAYDNEKWGKSLKHLTKHTQLYSYICMQPPARLPEDMLLLERLAQRLPDRLIYTHKIYNVMDWKDYFMEVFKHGK